MGICKEMGSYKAKITNIKNIDNLNIVTLECFGIELKMMSLELQNNINVGTIVIVTMKSTAISFAKDFHGEISISNQLDARVKEIKRGELLCGVKLLVSGMIFETFITMDSCTRLDLNIDDRVTVFIKASDISIGEVLDESY